MRSAKGIFRGIEHLLIFTHYEYAVYSSIAVLYFCGWRAFLGIALMWPTLIWLCDKYYVAHPVIMLNQLAIRFECRDTVHRDRKPAVLQVGNSPRYYLFGSLHRTDGPAIKGHYYLFGAEYSLKEFTEIVAGRSDAEIATFVYAHPKNLPRNNHQKNIERFLEMRGEKTLLNNLRAASELA